MEPVTPTLSHGFSLRALYFNTGPSAPILIILALLLSGWLIVLLIRPRPWLDHAAFLAASLLPFFTGFAGASWGLIQWLEFLGNGYIGPGRNPGVIALTQLALSLFGGSFLTCLFLPLGIVVLLVRRPH